jgi:hypothetical protein
MDDSAEITSDDLKVLLGAFANATTDDALKVPLSAPFSFFDLACSTRKVSIMRKCEILFGLDYEFSVSHFACFNNTRLWIIREGASANTIHPQ